MSEKVVEKIEELLRRRPSPLDCYGQLRVTVDTAIRRAHIINDYLDISKSKIIFLGDDDFTSIALSLLFTPKEVTVVEIDKRIINEITRINKEESLGITILEHDLRKPPPSGLEEKFDAFFADPYWNIWGFTLYFSRGIQFVRKDKETLAFISFKMPWLSLLIATLTYQANNAKEAKVHYFNSLFLANVKNVSLQRFYENFNNYELGITSSLYVVRISPRAHAHAGSWVGLVDGES